MSICGAPVRRSGRQPDRNGSKNDIGDAGHGVCQDRKDAGMDGPMDNQNEGPNDLPPDDLPPDFEE